MARTMGMEMCCWCIYCVSDNGMVSDYFISLLVFQCGLILVSWMVLVKSLDDGLYSGLQ